MPVTVSATAMLHALSPLAAWPWFFVSTIGFDGEVPTQITDLAPREALVRMAERLRVIRQKRRETSEKALAREAVGRGLTPAATGAGKTWIAHRKALHEAKGNFEDAKEERDRLWTAAEAAEQRLKDARTAYAAILRAKDETGRADQEAREARKHELFVARTELDLALKDAETAERVLVADLDDIYRQHPQRETIIVLARLLGTSENELMVLMGLRKQRKLNDEERSAFVRRVRTGEPVSVLIQEYHISERYAYQILKAHKTICSRAR